jgi:hypothetical protein
LHQRLFQNASKEQQEMTEDYTSPAIDQEAHKSEQAERLLQRQYALQKEAQMVLQESLGKLAVLLWG